MKRVVVTGMGMINAVGNNCEDAFNAICKGQSGVEKINSFDTQGYTVEIAAQVKNFDVLEIMSLKEAKKTSRFIHLGMKAAKEAMENSGLLDAKGSIDISERFGVVGASAIGGLDNIQKNTIICRERGSKKVSPHFIPSALINMLAGYVSKKYNLQGPNSSVASACAAGTEGIITAYKSIILNDADKMLVVAAEGSVVEIGISSFASMKALSTRNDSPQTASRPFDANRDGFVMGEGAGALILETLESAEARGAKIYCEIIGYGETSDAYHVTSPTPSGPLRAMQAAIRKVESNFGYKPKIDYVNAHGTSTPANDKNETLALGVLFNGKENCPPVTSIKGQIGHCLGAAGAIESITSIMALDKGIIPPTINYETKDEDCGLDYVPNEARIADLNIVMNNSFGFGGVNKVLIFKKYKKC